MTRPPLRPPARCGAATVETAVVLSVFLLFLFGVFEFARLVFVVQVMQNAAREGARLAVAHTNDKTDAEIKDEVRARMAGLANSLDGFDVEVSAVALRDSTYPRGTVIPSFNDARATDGVVVRIRGDFRPAVPRLLISERTITLQAKAVMYSEAN